MSASAQFIGRAFSATEYFLRMLRIYFWGTVNPRANQDLSVCFQIGVPRANQDFICLLWGEAEVRVAFNDRAERYHSRNLVTERGVIGQCDLIVERASKANLQNS